VHSTQAFIILGLLVKYACVALVILLCLAKSRVNLEVGFGVQFKYLFISLYLWELDRYIDGGALPTSTMFMVILVVFLR